MSKTLIWVLVGLVAAAGLAVVGFMEFGARPALAVVDSANAKGSVVDVAPAPSAVPASGSDSSAAAPTFAVSPSVAPTIDQLIQNAATYEGAPVSLSGTILTQCTAGCEFALDDGTGVLSVQLEGKGKDRLIPVGKVGKKIAVEGVFRASPRPQIVIDDPNGWQFVK